MKEEKIPPHPDGLRVRPITNFVEQAYMNVFSGIILSDVSSLSDEIDLIRNSDNNFSESLEYYRYEAEKEARNQHTGIVNLKHFAVHTIRSYVYSFQGHDELLNVVANRLAEPRRFSRGKGRKWLREAIKPNKDTLSQMNLGSSRIYEYDYIETEYQKAKYRMIGYSAMAALGIATPIERLRVKTVNHFAK